MLQRRSQFCLHIGTVSLTLAAFVITVIHNGLPQRTLFHYSSNSKESASNAEDPVQSLGWEDLLEKGMATHSSILTWRIPWAEEPGGLQSMGSHRVRHD